DEFISKNGGPNETPNSASQAANISYRNRAKRVWFEESCVRGAILKVAEFRDPRVNRKRRERELPAFSLLPPVPQRLAFSVVRAESLALGQRERRTPQGCLRDPGFLDANSLCLWLTRARG